jgi:hypothetical protein
VRREERGERRANGIRRLSLSLSRPPVESHIILINRDLVPPRQEDLDLFDFELSEAEMATLDAISLPMPKDCTP